MNKSKQKGTSWETAIVNLLNSKGFIAYRKVLSGKEDKGDICVTGVPLIIEAKNAKVYKLAEWIGEAETEAKNANELFGVVWMHRQGKSSPKDGYVVMSGETFTVILQSLESLYAPNDS